MRSARGFKIVDQATALGHSRCKLESTPTAIHRDVRSVVPRPTAGVDGSRFFEAKQDSWMIYEHLFRSYWY